MRSLSIFAITAVAWCTQTALAQLDVAADILKKSPPCAVPCIQYIITGGLCSIDSIAPCVCTNVTLQSDLSTCVQDACSFEDQIRAVAIENNLCVGYPQERKFDTVKLVSIVGSAIVFPIVILRFITRIYVTGRLWVDDYLTLMTTVVQLATVGIAFASTELGLGQHYWNLDPETGMLLLHRFYIVQILYILSLSFSKLAIAMLLRRIFQTSKFQRIADYLCAFLVIKGLVFLLLDCFQCLPVESSWDLTITDRTCLNLNGVGVAGAVASIIDDIGLLLLPLPWVWGLQLTYRTRIGLVFIFGVGSFACVTSMVRLKYISTFSRSHDPTWDDVEVMVWSLIEEFASLLCGCLPALWPLMALVSPRFFSRSGSAQSKWSRSVASNRFSRWKGSWSFMPAKRQNSALRISDDNDNIDDGLHGKSQLASRKGSDADEENIVMNKV